MSLEYIRQTYGVPAVPGRRVRCYDGRTGTIIGHINAYIEVRLDGRKNGLPYHPTDGITYLDEVIRPPRLTRSQERYQRYLRVAEQFRSFHHFLAYEQRQKSASA